MIPTPALTSHIYPYNGVSNWSTRVRILVQVTIYRRLRIGRDGYLDPTEAYDIS